MVKNTLPHFKASSGGGGWKLKSTSSTPSHLRDLASATFVLGVSSSANLIPKRHKSLLIREQLERSRDVSSPVTWLVSEHFSRISFFGHVGWGRRSSIGADLVLNSAESEMQLQGPLSPPSSSILSSHLPLFCRLSRIRSSIDFNYSR